jgi:hypothetical protein
MFGNHSRRLLPPLLALIALLVLAPAAMAADGVGVYGRTDDKVVTFFAFGLIAFFAILVTKAPSIRNLALTRVKPTRAAASTRASRRAT